jgi:fermentation-respiration switch protein FrsA (DUF1100 family)
MNTSPGDSLHDHRDRLAKDLERLEANLETGQRLSGGHLVEMLEHIAALQPLVLKRMEESQEYAAFHARMARLFLDALNRLSYAVLTDDREGALRIARTVAGQGAAAARISQAVRDAGTLAAIPEDTFVALFEAIRRDLEVVLLADTPPPAGPDEETKAV